MDPRSPSWRPDPPRRRLATIRLARRVEVIAAVLFAPVGAVGMAILPPLDPLDTPMASALAGLAGLADLAGVALLGAGLAPAALGSRIDGLAVGVARSHLAYIRNTPKCVSGIGAWSAASMPIVSTRRVSIGSMTPSSQRRAVAK